MLQPTRTRSSAALAHVCYVQHLKGWQGRGYGHETYLFLMYAGPATTLRVPQQYILRKFGGGLRDQVRLTELGYLDAHHLDPREWHSWVVPWLSSHAHEVIPEGGLDPFRVVLQPVLMPPADPKLMVAAMPLPTAEGMAAVAELLARFKLASYEGAFEEQGCARPSQVQSRPVLLVGCANQT